MRGRRQAVLVAPCFIKSKLSMDSLATDVSNQRHSDVSIGLLPILRKEVIQPQVPLRLPCYDFTPVADPTVAGCLLAVSAPS